MHATNFVRLCDGLHSLLGLGSPVPTRRQGGLQVLRLSIQGVDAYLLCAPGTDEQAGCLVVEFGPLPQSGELEGWLDLLDTNRDFHGACAPRFCRDPETGAVLLQWGFGLQNASSADVHSRLLEMARMASEWRLRHTKDFS